MERLELASSNPTLYQRAFSSGFNVKQLGLAHLVYPGAGYSRFSHSVGACHVAGRMMRALNQNGLRRWDDHEIQKYRLAALLHDVGHYPFSHAMEHVLQDHYKAETYLTGSSSQPSNALASEEPPAYDHETLGRQIIEHDAEIGPVLAEHKFTRDEIRAVFSREQPDGLSNLVSSDLDCDRLDYMMRTAHAAGLPYGTVDVEYLTTQMCVDSEGYLCLTKKALRAADHFLVSRYYDYTQVAYHKTVVGLEEVLKDVISGLIAHGLDCSGSGLKAMVLDGSFAAFDDQAVISRMRALLQTLGTTDPILGRKLRCVLRREAPKLVAASERIGRRESTREHLNNVDQLRRLIPNLAEQFTIPKELWHLWKAKLNLSKIGSSIPVGDVDGESFDEELQQVVRILTTDKHDPSSRSRPLIEHDFALLKELANVRLYATRLYVHLPEDCAKPAELRLEISSKIRAELPNFPFSG